MSSSRGDRARTRALQQGHSVRKGGVRCDYGAEGSRSSAIRRAPQDRRKPSGRAQFPEFNDRILALATGKTQQEIATACKGVRPNHVGAAIARHKRAGRIEEHDGKLYARSSAETERPAIA